MLPLLVLTVCFWLVLQVAEDAVSVDVLGDGIQTTSHKNGNTQSMSSRSMKRQQAEAHSQQRHLDLRQHQHHHPHDQQPKTQSVRVVFTHACQSIAPFCNMCVTKRWWEWVRANVRVSAYI